MYCPKCHNAMDPELPKCKYCGFLNKQYDYNKDRTINVDYKHTGLNILSLLIPVLGLIIYLANKDSSPKKAKSVINYTISGTIIYILIFILIKLL